MGKSMDIGSLQNMVRSETPNKKTADPEVRRLLGAALARQHRA
jgi:hypothetical protein